MTILQKALKIFETYYLCPYCLGRMFSLLGTSVSNLERANSILLTLTMESHHNYLSGEKTLAEESLTPLKILAEKALFPPARQVLAKEGIKDLHIEKEKDCYLCHNLFFHLKSHAEKALPLVEDIEFKNFLVGTRLTSEIVNTEDKFKAEFNLLEAEAFKSHFNREMGKILADVFDKPAEFNTPDLLLMFEIKEDALLVKPKIKPLFIFGRYQKLIRGIPQTHWECKKCRGKGCELCNSTGKQYPTSVEELISPTFIETTHASTSKFHGAGREDIDVRMMGKGRPFIIELKNPKIRTVDLTLIEETVNSTNRDTVQIADLRYSTKQEVISIKSNAENAKKVYKALVESDMEVTSEAFQEKLTILQEKLVGHIINQRTPVRVSHRRSDLIRDKKIFAIQGKYLSTTQFEFIIETQGGTYIKELISGDNGRTSPSISEIFDTPLVCRELDVIMIEY